MAVYDSVGDEEEARIKFRNALTNSADYVPEDLGDFEYYIDYLFTVPADTDITILEDEWGYKKEGTIR